LSESGSSLSALLVTAIAAHGARTPPDEARLLLARERQRLLVESLVEATGGEWVERAGEWTLARFTSALDAVRCARSIQQTLAGDADLSLRIAVHAGEVSGERGRSEGSGVPEAGALCALAPPGGIALSAGVYGSVRDQEPLEVRSLGERALGDRGTSTGVFVIEAGIVAPWRGRSLLQSALRLEVLLAAAALLGLALFAWYRLASRFGSGD
jgi:class 3 adenylate cyclase